MSDRSGILWPIVEQVVAAANVETLRHFRSGGLDIDNKDVQGGFDPVTVADRAAETAMRKVIGELRPDDGIFGEEFGKTSGTSGLTWVLDPIDGTRAYMCGLPCWGTLVSVEDADGPMLGAIAQPFIDEVFQGGLGRSEVRQGGAVKPSRVKPCADLADALLMTTFPEVGTPEQHRAFARVASHVRLTRYGFDCYAYAMLAHGQIDLVIEAGLSAYDISAPIAVIEAAGGIVTTWDGGPAHGGGAIVAAGDARVHAQALELLARGG